MNPKCDRTEISRMMLPLFPSMATDATSDEWHYFLESITGDVVAKAFPDTPSIDVPNTNAFDKWRQALAKQGYPTWGYTQGQTDAMKVRAEQLKQAEASRLSKEPELLAALAKEAPLVTAAELLKPKP